MVEVLQLNHNRSTLLLSHMLGARETKENIQPCPLPLLTAATSPLNWRPTGSQFTPLPHLPVAMASFIPPPLHFLFHGQMRERGHLLSVADPAAIPRPHLDLSTDHHHP